MQMPVTDAEMYGNMSAAEHSAMTSDCESTACTTMIPPDCAALCFVASGMKIDTGVLPSSSVTLFIIIAAASVLALVFSHRGLSPHLAFVPLAHLDPRLILTTHKRE